MSGFTAEEEQRLRDLAAVGYSQQEVADLLGMTKNKVAGKANRLGIVFGGSRRRRGEAGVEPATSSLISSRSTD